jgi:hypothetical protein
MYGFVILAQFCFGGLCSHVVIKTLFRDIIRLWYVWCSHWPRCIQVFHNRKTLFGNVLMHIRCLEEYSHLPQSVQGLPCLNGFTACTDLKFLFAASP